MKRVYLVLLLPLLLGLMAFRQVPLTDPPPISIPAGLSDAQVTHVIAEALMQRGWTIVKRLPGELDATYAPRDFSVTIAVHYTPQQIQINYVDSNNLKYEVKNGVRYIHTNYANWIQNLVSDIKSRLVMAQ